MKYNSRHKNEIYEVPNFLEGNREAMSLISSIDRRHPRILELRYFLKRLLTVSVPLPDSVEERGDYLHLNWNAESLIGNSSDAVFAKIVMQTKSYLVQAQSMTDSVREDIRGAFRVAKVLESILDYEATDRARKQYLGQPIE